MKMIITNNNNNNNDDDEGEYERIEFYFKVK